MTEQRLLITGGAGFIGANLCRRLADNPEREIICLDNLFTGRRENIADLLGTPNFRLVEHDVTQPLPGDIGRVTHVFNLACPASPPHYQKDKEYTILTSVLGARHVLDFARQSGPETVVFQASTSEVYGDPDISPQVESYVGKVNPVGPRACYDEGKRVAEALFLAHREKYGTRVRLGRIFNTYGPMMDPEDGRVVSNFIMQALRGDPLTIYGDGSQTRSFCYVDDLVKAITRLAFAAPDDFAGPVNIGNPGEFTIRELADLVLEMTGSRSAVESRPLPQDDPKQRRPDITLAGEVLGWKPEIPLRDGLRKTIEYFRRYIA